MSAAWPYDDEPPEPDHGEPSWACPDQICDCNAPDADEEKVTFSVLLRNYMGEPMKGARVRVLVNGLVVNDDAPYADGDGRIEVELVRKPVRARVEWAPADTPSEPIYPYRKSYFVELREELPREAARRRLHNLGFGHWPDFAYNVRDFQRDLGYPNVNGRLEDIEDDLRNYHDHGVVPSPPPSADGDGGGAV